MQITLLLLNYKYNNNTTEVRATGCWRMSTIGTSVDNSELLFNFFTNIGIIILMTIVSKGRI